MKLILHPDVVVLAFAHHMLSLMSVLFPSRRQMLARGVKSSCCSGSSGSSGGSSSSSSRSSSRSGSSSCSISSSK